MGWVRIDGGLTCHRKTIDLRSRLGEPLAEAYLQRLWLWCHDNADDGKLRSIDPTAAIETVVQWAGEKGAFARAVIECGFVDEAADGSLSIHDWDEHNGKYIRKAKQDAKRMRKARQKFKKEAEKEHEKRSRTVREPPPDVPGNETRRDETRPHAEKRQQQPARAAREATDGLLGTADATDAEELRGLWNAAHAKPGRFEEFPAWEALAPDQVASAASLARRFDHPRWERFFELASRSYFMNGGGEKGWILSPQKLLEKGAPFVVAALNGEYKNARDLPAPRGAA